MARKSLLLAGLATAALLSPLKTQAQVSFYGGGGTLGVGGGLAIGVAPNIDIRAEYLGGNSTSDTRTDGNDYRTRVHFSNPGLLADLYFGGRFHVTGGLYYANNKVNVEGRPSSTGEYELNNRRYSANGATLNGETELRKGIAPYLGVGWGTRPASGRGIGWRLEVGAMYMKPSTKLTSTGLSGPTLAQDLAAEEQKVNDKLDRYKIYPAVSAYFNWTF